MSRKSWIIQFRRLEGDKYTVFVDRPGDANDFTAVLPPSIEDLWAKPQRTATDVRGGTRKFRKDVASLPIHQQFFSAENSETLQDIGDRILSAVFNPENNQLGQDNIAALKTLMSLNDGLDIEFDLSQTPELSGVPWEALYVNSTDSFLAANPNTNVVRRIRAQCEAPEKIQGPVRLLVVASNPKGDLGVTKEINAIQQRIEKIGNSQMIFDKLEDATRDALSDKIADYQPHILHYIGHSDFEEDEGNDGEGYLFLHGEDDEDGKTSIDRLSSADLRTMMQYNRPALAVLNSCESGVTSVTSPKAGLAQCLVGRINIPFVVAMQNPVSDQAAIAFSTRFYASIARGDSIATAVTKGRSKISENGNEWVKLELITPVLYTSTKTRLDEPLVMPVAKNATPAKDDVDSTDKKEKSSLIGKKTIWASVGGALAGTVLLISQVEAIVDFGTKAFCWIGIGQCSAESPQDAVIITQHTGDQTVEIKVKAENLQSVLKQITNAPRSLEVSSVEVPSALYVQTVRTQRLRVSAVKPLPLPTSLELAEQASLQGYRQTSGIGTVPPLIGGGGYSAPVAGGHATNSRWRQCRTDHSWLTCIVRSIGWIGAKPLPPPAPPPPPPPPINDYDWPIAVRYQHARNGVAATTWPSPFPVVQCDRPDFGDNVEFSANSSHLNSDAAIPIWSATNAIEICNARYVNVTSYLGELAEYEGRELSFRRGEVVSEKIISSLPHLPIEISIGSEVWDPDSRSNGTLIGGEIGSVAGNQIASYPEQQSYAADTGPSAVVPADTEVGLVPDPRNTGVGATISERGNRLGGTLIGGGGVDAVDNPAYPDSWYNSSRDLVSEMHARPFVRITSTATCPSIEEMAGSVFFAPDSDQLEEKAKESIRKAVSRNEGSASGEREIHLSAFSRRMWQMNETGSMPSDIDLLEYGRLISVANFIAGLPDYVPEDIKGGMYGSMCHNYDLPGADSLQYHQVDIRIVPKTRVDTEMGSYHRMVGSSAVYYSPPVSDAQQTDPPDGLLSGGSLPVENSQTDEPMAPADDR